MHLSWREVAVGRNNIEEELDFSFNKEKFSIQSTLESNSFFIYFEEEDNDKNWKFQIIETYDDDEEDEDETYIEEEEVQVEDTSQEIIKSRDTGIKSLDDESFVIETINKTCSQLNINIENLPNTKYRPTKNGIILDKKKLMNKYFNEIQECGNITDFEMHRTFNCGIGMMIFIPENNLNLLSVLFNKNKISYIELGRVANRNMDEEQIQIV